MNRRSFLKSLVAAAVVTQCPLPALSPSADSIKWVVEKFDYELAIGVGAQVGNKRYAVWMPRSKNNEADIRFLKKELVRVLRDKGWIA